MYVSGVVAFDVVMVRVEEKGGFPTDGLKLALIFWLLLTVSVTGRGVPMVVPTVIAYEADCP
jgi:hypothetical protein